MSIKNYHDGGCIYCRTLGTLAMCGADDSASPIDDRALVKRYLGSSAGGELGSSVILGEHFLEYSAKGSTYGSKSSINGLNRHRAQIHPCR